MANTEFYYQDKVFDAMLFVFDANGKMSKYLLDDRTSIGRKTPQNNPTVALFSSIVSRNHGEINFIGGKYYYTDNDSANGTYINGTLIGKKSPQDQTTKEIKDGDIIQFDILKNGEHHSERLICIFTTSVSKGVKWKRIKLSDEIAEIGIGRSSSSGLNLQNDRISENHASFFSSQTGWAIIDHQSTNGVFVNAKKIDAPKYLNNGDIIRIANVFFVFLGDTILFCQEPNDSENKFNGKKLTINITERSVIQRFQTADKGKSAVIFL